MAWGAVGPTAVTLAAWALGRSAPVEVRCQCECGGKTSDTAFALLERQLERCGPEQLARAPQAAPEQPLLLVLGLTFVLGCLAGAFACYLLGAYCAPQGRPRRTIAPLPAPAVEDEGAGPAAESGFKGAKLGKGKGQLVIAA